jgi:uncharacterized protein
MPTDIIGRGWTFPIPATSGGPTLTGGEAKIRQSIWIILSTAPGERIMVPGFGCGVHDLVFSANTATLHGLVAEQVRESLTRWEPRVDVLGVTVEAPADARNHLIISIDCRIRTNNAIFNLVYPFFLNEGPDFPGVRRAT